MQPLRIGILAYGSLIYDPGEELNAVTIEQIPKTTPFKVEFARSSRCRGGAPTLVPVDAGGSPVAALVLLLNKTVSVASAQDMLYRRETNKIGKAVEYVRPPEPSGDEVVVEHLTNTASCDLVLYTKIGSNIAPMTGSRLADLAIASARLPVGGLKRDGICYLAAAKRHGIETPLSGEYEAQILAKTCTASLEDAWESVRGPSTAYHGGP